MNKCFKSAPLPFMGQKRRFLKTVITSIKDFPVDSTYVDLFGGSGLLSHVVKNHYPESTVVYNDFDNYRERLGHIDETNALLRDLYVIAKECAKSSRVPENVKHSLLLAIKGHEQKFGFVDYVTVSASLLFSMKIVTNFEELEKQGFYNCVVETPYSAEGYLDGLEVVCQDYRALFEAYKDVPNVVWLVDPPYLSTQSGAYKSTHWKLRDYLDVLNVLEGSNYLYFTSNKSEIVELCEWIETRTSLANPFKGATTTTVGVQMNHTSRYEDMMLIKYDFK